MTKFSDNEYQRLKKFLGLFYDWFEAKPHQKPENHPLAVLAGFEIISLSQAKRGLEMAINDCLEMSSAWTPEQVAEADKRFLEHHAPALSELRRGYSKKYLQILKRGQIKSLQEYYFVKGIMDGAAIEPGAGESEQLANMLATFEQQLKPDCET